MHSPEAVAGVVPPVEVGSPATEWGGPAVNVAWSQVSSRVKGAGVALGEELIPEQHALIVPN